MQIRFFLQRLFIQCFWLNMPILLSWGLFFLLRDTIWSAYAIVYTYYFLQVYIGLYLCILCYQWSTSKKKEIQWADWISLVVLVCGAYISSWAVLLFY
ncbi:hypothetical protein ACPDHL_04220 [Myroides sp. C15-4]|uniref:hypothetical protein n=1 Tax=Myroides sp. C15-4 TaxID=3400532 RepID=UPI003D2F9B3F